MQPQELSSLLVWANDGTRTLHYAFAIAADDGILNLSRFHKGKSILHDLLKTTDDLDLKSRRFGTLSVDASSATVRITPNKPFGVREEKSLKQVLRQTRVKSYGIEFAAPGGDDEPV
jgi:hypothetical protein